MVARFVMKSKKQRIISIIAVVTMAIVLSCALVACDKAGTNKTGTEKAADYKVTIHPNNGQGDIVWDITKAIPTITKDGFHIAGYFLDAQLTISTTLESLKATGITKNIDVYIKWEEDICEHVEVTDVAVAPTCTEKGLTEGKHCSKCGKILKAQTEIDALGHDFKNGVCTRCGDDCTSKGLEYSLDSNENSYTVTGIGVCADKNIVIPSEYNSKPVTSIDGYAFFNCNSIVSVTIPDSVTSIGYQAFCACRGLASVTIPDSVTSIGKSAFEGCTELTSITIPKNIKNIENNAFYGCRNLTTVIWNATECTNVGSSSFPIFENCLRLSTVSIGNNVLVIPSCAFYGCSGLANVTIGNGVMSIGSSAFSGCTGLTSVTIGNGVTSIGYQAFYGCKGLTNVYITDIEKWCKILGIDNLMDYNTGDKKKLYLNGELITDLVIPNGVTSIGGFAFSCCTDLTSITIPDSVTSIGDNAFKGCTGLSSITVADGNTKYHSSDNCLIETAYKTLIFGCKTSVIPSDGSVTSIGSSAFRGCKDLTSITIPDSVTYIGSGAFASCTGLTSITIPDSVTSIDNEAFSSCTRLTSVTIGNRVTFICDFTFFGCSGLTSVTIGNSVTGVGYNAFAGCSGLTTVFYAGTAEQWDAISIHSRTSNTNLTSATRYYYSETEPALNADGTAYDGNFWHYDTDGNVSIWKKEN